MAFIDAQTSDRDEAVAFARGYSAAHRGEYVWLVNAFGAFIATARRLPVYAPSASATGTYFLNGSEKPFSTAQKVADQNATPTLS